MELRYSRQESLFGAGGQAKLARARVLIVGAGALGSTVSAILTRSGIGALRICDGDTVDLTNLHRQGLYDESDAQAHVFKASTAKAKLARMNSDVALEAFDQRLTAENFEEFSRDCDLIVDCTDNHSARYLINEHALKLKKSWVYGGVAEGCGMAAFFPAAGKPCLRCLWPSPENLQNAPKLRDIFPAAPVLVGSIEASLALRALAISNPPPALWTCDLLRDDLRRLPLSADPECPCCSKIHKTS